MKPEQIHSFGQAAIVGAEGELEHAAAILHSELGQSMRKVLKAGKAVIPSAKKVAVAGTTIDLPLHYKDEMRVRSQYDAMEIRVGDAPRPYEIRIAIAFTGSGRPLAWVPGLTLREFLQKKLNQGAPSPFSAFFLACAFRQRFCFPTIMPVRSID